MSESFPVAAPEEKVKPATGVDIDLDALEPRVDATVPPELLSRRKGEGSKEELVRKEQDRLYGYPYLAQAYAELGEMTTDVSVSEKELLPAPIRAWIKDRAAILSTFAYYREYAPDQESALSNAKNDLEQAVRRGVCQERQRYFVDRMDTSTRKLQELTMPQASPTSDSQIGLDDQAKIRRLLADFAGNTPMPKVDEPRDGGEASSQPIPEKGLLARMKRFFQ